MLSDDQLTQVARNLDALDISPALRLKIVVAVVGPLMVSETRDAPPAPRSPPAARAPRLGNGRAAAYARQTHGEPMARAREALERDPSLSTADLIEKAHVSRATANRARSADPALTTNGSKPPKPARSADADLGTNGTKRPLSAAVALDPDAKARQFIAEGLKRGPVECALIDAEVDKGRLNSAAVDRALAELDLVSCRVRKNGGPRVCWATRDQAAELGAVVAEKGARTQPAPAPSL